MSAKIDSVTVQYDRDEAARLCRELRVDAENLPRTTLRHRYLALADQLEAAGREVERWRQFEQQEEGYTNSLLEERDQLIVDSDKLRAEVERLTSERDRAVEDMEAAEQRMAGVLDGTFSVGDGSAQREIERLRAELSESRKQWMATVLEHDRVRERFTAELALLIPVVEAAVRVAELDEICMNHLSIDDDAGNRAEVELPDAVAARAATIDAYRAAQDKAGG